MCFSNTKISPYEGTRHTTEIPTVILSHHCSRHRHHGTCHRMLTSLQGVRFCLKLWRCGRLINNRQVKKNARASVARLHWLLGGGCPCRSHHADCNSFQNFSTIHKPVNPHHLGFLAPSSRNVSRNLYEHLPRELRIRSPTKTFLASDCVSKYPQISDWELPFLESLDVTSRSLVTSKAQSNCTFSEGATLSLIRCV